MEPMQAVGREKTEGTVIGDQDKRINAAHCAALILLAGSIAAAPLATALGGFAGFVIAYAVALLAWVFVHRAPFRFGAVVAMAIALRVMLLFAQPALSGDVYRYLWDGRTLASGHNPYTSLPTDPRINHPEIATIYPPHAEILFAGLHQLALWRLLLIAADLMAVFLLREKALPYATFPPLLIEGAWNGHIEPIVAVLLLIALRYNSAIAAAIASGLKLIPLAALPALIMQSKRRLRFVIVFAIALVVPTIPFLIAGPLMPGLQAYATRWIFNSPLYDAAFSTIEWLQIPMHWKSGFTAIKDPLHLQTVSKFVYVHLYSDFLARALLAVAAICLIVRFRRDPAASIGSLLICSPAIHPWYWLVLAPFASGAWLWLALFAPFSYLLYAGFSKWLVYALCYAVPLLIARLPLSTIATSGAGSRWAAIRFRTARGTSPR